jgi:predicted Zn-dependent protease with MMP-like domain
MKRILIASDMHCGNYWGLTPPEWQVDTYRPIQQKLWEFWEEVTKDPYDIAILNGDLIDGLIDSAEHVTAAREEQLKIAVTAINKIKTNRLYIVEGTPAHVSGEASFERLLGKLLGVEAHPYLRLDVEGTRIHVRHVLGSGATPYSSAIRKEAVRQVWIDESNGIDPPHVVIRSHVHYYHIDQDERVMGIVVPALQLPFSIYGRTRRTWKYDVGVVILHVGNELCLPRPMLLKLKTVRGEVYEQV